MGCPKKLFPAFLLSACIIMPVLLQSCNSTTPAADVYISVTPTSLSFDNLSVGLTASKNVTITSDASGTGTVTGNVTISGTDFSITSGEGHYSLTPGQSQTVVVSFAPTAAAARSGILNISDNSSNLSNSAFNIPLSGTGTAVLAPSAPTAPISPTNGATGISTSPVFSWSNPTGTIHNRLQVSTTSSFTTLIYDFGDGNDPQQISGLANNTIYYWRVNASNANGTSAYSSTWSFTTTGAPSAPTLISPANGATSVSTSPTLSWNASTGATSYHLQVSTTSGFTSFVYDQGVATNSQSLTGFAPSTTYYWRASASNTGGTSAYSSAWNFTTRMPIPGEQWTLRSATTNSIKSIAWGNSQFVAVTTTGFLTSPDGINWTARASGTIYDQALRYITWSGSQFLAEANSSNGSIILTSTDGINWTTHSFVTNSWVYSIVRSSSLFVGVGYNGAIATSPDGITWTARPSPTTYTLNSVVWTGAQFVAVGPYQNGTVLTSSNGTAWAAGSSGTTNTIYSVTWSGTQLVAVGSGVILTSSDALTWIQRPIPSGAPSSTLTSIAWSGSLFVAVGNYGTILTSPDGITWTSRTSGTTSTLNTVAWSGTKLVAGASNGTVVTSP